MTHIRLVRYGYGSLKEVREFDAREVLRILQYENFISDYQEAYLQLNGPEEV